MWVSSLLNLEAISENPSRWFGLVTDLRVGSVTLSCFVIAISSIFTGIIPTLLIIVWMGVVQVFCGNILAPTLMTESVGLSTIGIIFSVFFFGQLMGTIGMLLAVPIAGTIKVLLSYLVRAAANPVSDGQPTRFVPERTGIAQTNDDRAECTGAVSRIAALPDERDKT